MATFVLFGSSQVAQSLDDGQNGFIGQLGSLATAGDAITGSGAISVSVYGSLFGISNAIDHDGTNFDLHVGKNGVVGSRDGDTMDIDVTESAFVSNDGSLLSGSDALDIRGTASIRILNTGSISGDSDGIVTSSTDTITRIINQGTIAGGTGGIDHLEGDAVIINRGAIAGENYGYSGADNEDRLRNSGSVEGGAFMETGDDRVSNAGTIDHVFLGDGDDVYIGRGSGYADTVDGGDGKDKLTSSRADDTFIGGGAKDTFIFAANGGSDEVRDFGGQDKIDLTALGLTSFGASLSGRIEEVKNGSVIDLAQYDLMIFLRGVDKVDLGGADFIL
jgi:hypothetical protein